MTTLSLKLPPEVAKIMPWIVAAKKTGDRKQAAWAKKEYEIARERAAQRERWEREREERRRENERLTREREERWERQAEERRKRDEYHALLGIHYAEEDGWEYIQPCHSSQKGWRRLLSECTDVVDKRRFDLGAWGSNHDRIRSNQTCGKRNKYRGDKHNCGRKPRKPWFKKTRRRPF